MSSRSSMTKNSEDIIICKNCGEENPVENSDCFSCGIPLKGNKIKKNDLTRSEAKGNDSNQSSRKNISDNQNRIK